MNRYISTETAERFRRNRNLHIGLVLLLALVFASLIGPFVVPYDPLAIDFATALAPPSLAHPFGTDDLGRDVLARVVAAAKVDLEVVAVCVLLPFLIGSTVGLIFGYFGGWLDLDMEHLNRRIAWLRSIG